MAVRERAGLPDTMIGTDLMNKAFGDQGPLSDPARSKAEREGLQSRYRGAIRVFKNPTSHRSVEFRSSRGGRDGAASRSLASDIGPSEGQPSTLMAATPVASATAPIQSDGSRGFRGHDPSEA